MSVVRAYGLLASQRLLVFFTFLILPQFFAQNSNTPGTIGLNYAMENGYARITTITPGLPAARAGLMPGDWITAVNGQTMVNLTYQQMLNSLLGPVGAPLLLQINRNGSVFQVTLIRVARTNQPPAQNYPNQAPPAFPSAPPANSNLPPAGIGATVAFQNGYPYFSQVTPNFPAAQSGVFQGDWILAINGYNVANTSLDYVISLLRGAPGTPVQLSLQRNNQNFQVTLYRQLLQQQQLPARGFFGFDFQIQAGYPYVTSVTQGMPAALAGMLPGDWLVSVDGRSLANLNKTQAQALFLGNAGVTSSILIQRNGQKYQLNLTRVAR